MAITRRFRRARRVRRARRRKATALTVAKRALRLVRVQRPEVLHFGTASSVLIETPATWVNLTPIAQGDGPSDRTGNQILLKGITLRFTVDSAGAVATWQRIMIVRDRQQIGDTPPSDADLFENPGATQYLSPLAIATSGRFKVLFNKVFSLSNSSAETDTKYVSIYLRCNSQVRFNGSTATDIQRNGHYLVMMSSGTTTSRPTLTYNYRVGYTDA